MDWKRTGNKLLFPPLWVMTLLSVCCAAGLVTVFAKGLKATIPAYLIYVLSFYTLTVVCIYCSRVLPRRCRRIRVRADENPFLHRWSTDRQFRAKGSLYLSLGINILHIALQVIQCLVFHSWWFVVLAVYYSILSLMRYLLVRYVQRNSIGSSILSEWKRSRTCACILLLVNLSLSGAVLMILYQNRGWEYHGILIYVIALYTFYSTIHAALDLIKYRKLGSPVMSTTKIVSLSATLVSMLNLETAMFSQFGKDMKPEHQRIFIILTGAGVSIIIVSLSLMLILRANKEIRRKKYESGIL